MKAFLFDTLLADGHLADIIEFSFSISETSSPSGDTLLADGHLDDIIETNYVRSGVAACIVCGVIKWELTASHGCANSVAQGFVLLGWHLHSLTSTNPKPRVFKWPECNFRSGHKALAN